MDSSARFSIELDLRQVSWEMHGSSNRLVGLTRARLLVLPAWLVVPFWLAALLWIVVPAQSAEAQEIKSEAIESTKPVDLSIAATFIEDHCLDCHNSADNTAGLDLEKFDVEIGRQPPVDWDVSQWELIVRRLRGRQMPPPDYTRPHEAEYQQTLSAMEGALDLFSQSHPQPGRTDSIRRLTRTEYRNSIRDLLGIEIAVEEFLPADESSHGFDNVTVGELSPTLLNRYITAAEKISRLAVGSQSRSPDGVTIRIPPDLTQQEHVDGLPLGTRGGVLVKHYFPVAGEYQIQLRLARDRDEKVEGLNRPHDIDLLVDSAREHRFTVKPPRKGESYENADFTNVDAHLKARIQVTAGTHEIGATFPRQSDSLLEIKRQPFDASFNRHRHPRPAPAILEVSIIGPLADNDSPAVDKAVDVDSARPASDIDVDTPTRQRLFICRPTQPADAENCAETILNRLMRIAYRRPVSAEDLQSPMQFFRRENEQHGFDAGIEAAVAAILINPNFLFRIEQDPSNIESATAYEITDLELASRLSFFIWSSLPDDELLTLAEVNQLSDPDQLHRQVMRMIADDRSRSLVDNFAAQWLYLRNLASITPDLRQFPDFDHNLREAFRLETESLFEAVVKDDLSVLRLIDSDDTFLNERLAKHYGIAHVRDSYFRRVSLPDDSRRGGLLRHGSILMLTSYATRTSPTVRGHWILENIIGTPPPPPPPNVPSLAEKSATEAVSIRERLAQHRADPTCASCHNLMDPIGFSLDNFDAVGRWRDFQDGEPVDALGSMPDGSEIDGVNELERAILARPELFVGTLTEKLLTFALGRGIEPTDAPAIRKIVRDAAKNDYRMSSLLEGIVFSQPFRMRTSQ
jgi:hypothetical protein